MSDTLPELEQISLTTERLVLRPMVIEDATRIHELVNDKDIAYNCVNIPYPYPEGAAEAWIVGHPLRYAQRQAVIFAITKDQTIIGACGIEFMHEEQHYDIGYWIGKDFWGNGYATEAATMLVDYGLNTLGIDELYAESLSSNPSSCAVLQKCGMQHVARISKPCHSPHKEEDVEIYHIQRAN